MADKEARDQRKSYSGTEEGKQPCKAEPCKFSPLPSVQVVSIKDSTEDKKRYADEEKYREKQLTLARCMNWITAISVIVGVIGIGLLVVNFHLSTIATDAAVDQARTSKKEFELSQRPWISLEMTADGLQVNDDSAFISTYFKLKNVGHSVATSVVYLPRLIANPNINLDHICDGLGPEGLPVQKDRQFGTAIFPDQTSAGGWPAGIPKSLMTEAMKKPILPNVTLFDLEGCVFYRSPVDESWHHTQIVYHVMRKGSYTDSSFTKTDTPQSVSLLMDSNGEKAD